MRSVSRRQLRCKAVALVVPFVLGFLQVAVAGDETALFASSETRSVETPAHGAPGPVRLGRLDQHALSAAAIRIVLPDGRELIAHRDTVANPDGQHPTWSGSIDGLPRSAVAITSQRGLYSGQIQTGRETFELAPFWTGEYMLYAVDASCTPPFVRARTTETSQHRLVVLYTPATRVRWADSGGIEARIAAAIAVLNRLSRPAQPWVIDDVQEVAYAETGDLRSALHWLERSGEAERAGSPDRNAGASVVALITEDNNQCGVTSTLRGTASYTVRLHAIYSSCLSNADLALQFENSAPEIERVRTAAEGTLPFSSNAEGSVP
jgi:hypothetical protein